MSLRVLALDVGTKRIGVAVSDLTATVAQPLRTITVNNEAEVIKTVADLVSECKVVELVVGEPKTLKGVFGKQAGLVYQLAEKIAAAAKVPLIYWDERLSSKEAQRYLKEKGKKIKKGDIDMIAAALILQSYLEKRRA